MRVTDREVDDQTLAERGGDSAHDELQQLRDANSRLEAANALLQLERDEIKALQGDLAALVEGVQVPMVLVDRACRVRVATPEAAPLFRIRPQDQGRPLADFVNAFGPELTLQAHEAMRSGRAVVRRVRDGKGREHDLRVRPRIGRDGGVEGATVLAFDVPAPRSGERSDVAWRVAQALLDAIPQPLVVVDGGLGVCVANTAFSSLSGVDRGALAGRAIVGLHDGAWRSLAAPLASLVQRGHCDFSAEVLAAIGPATLRVRGSAIEWPGVPKAFLIDLDAVSAGI